MSAVNKVYSLGFIITIRNKKEEVKLPGCLCSLAVFHEKRHLAPAIGNTKHDGKNYLKTSEVQ